MDSPARAALGGGLISALAIGGIVAAGVLATSAAVVVADPTAPPAAAAGLTRFQDCGTLRQWYVDHTIHQVGPWGWAGRAWPVMAESTRRAPDTVSGSATGTNTQETGVDEPDVAKTDGRIVVRLEDGRHLLVTDVSGSRPRELADWQLPRSSYAEGLLLVDHHALLASGGPAMGREGFLPGADTRTTTYDVDLTDPSRPRLAGTTTWPGRQLSMRQYADTVRLVTSAGLPSLPFVHPRPGALSGAEATRRNREIVRSSTAADWIPGLSCDEVYRPSGWAGDETVTVSTFRPGSVGDATKVAVVGAGSEVYSSATRLYVTSTDWDYAPVRRAVRDSLAGPDIAAPRPRTSTHIHAFALDGDTTRYVASGVVSGEIRDHWSLDEHDGHLRVAVSWPATGQQPSQNGIVVLDEHGNRLEQVGMLRGLGVNEAIQSVRWFDDLAVVVTFRQQDPLYTVDLTDPTRPHPLGELRTPGFSAYLHPIGDGRLLGLGSAATSTGRALGAQAAVFDVGNPAHARRLSRDAFGPGSRFGVADDPHAFTWLPDQRSAIVGLDRVGGSAPVLLHVSADGTITERDLPSVGGWGQRALPLGDGRVALVGDSVRIIDVS